MEVILKKDVEGVGKAGSVIKVKDGFARNFLLLKDLAVVVSSGNIKKLDEEAKAKSLKLEKQKKEAEELKERLAAVSLTIPVLTQEKEKIFGSIGSLEIERALKDEGIKIDKTMIALDEPLKTLGIYQVPVNLHPEVQAQVKVWIVKK